MRDGRVWSASSLVRRFVVRVPRLTGLCFLAAALACRATAADLPTANSGKDPVVIDDKTEAVVKGALKWLAAKQSPNGAWAMSEEEQRHPIAITGYTISSS